MLALVKIRLIQVIREFRNTGPVALLLPLVVAFLVFASYKMWQQQPHAYYLAAGLLLSCIFIQFYRNDKQFVYNHVERPHLVLFSEYIFFALPFSISCLLSPTPYLFPLLVAAIATVPYIKYSIAQKTRLKYLSAFIPPHRFEWISGIRKNFIYLLPLYVLALGFSWFRILPLFFLFLITVSIASFYNECEPVHILKEGNPKPNKFLITKLLDHSKFMLLLYAPVLIINTAFNPGDYILLLLFIPVQISLVCFAICLKYANYRPHEESFANSITLSVVALGSAIPFLLPVPAIMAIIYFARARKNLESYLDDNHK